MAKPNRIEEELTADQLEQLHKLINTPGWTIQKLLTWLNEELGYDFSQSGLGRYTKEIREVGQAMQETSTITQAMVRELGPDAVEGETGRVLVQMFQTIIMKFMMTHIKPGEGKTPLAPMDMMLMAKSLSESVKALKGSADFEERIEKRVREQMVKELDKAVEEAEADGEPGLKGKRLDALKEKFLGVRKQNAEGA